MRSTQPYPAISDQTYDAIDAFDQAHQRAVELVKHLRKERHPLAWQLSAVLTQLLKHQAAIVEAAIDAPVAASPAVGGAHVLQLVPRPEAP